MPLKFHNLLILGLLALSLTSWAQNPNQDAAFRKACLKQVTALKPSYQDQTAQGVPYALFILKEAKDWIIIVADTGSYYSFRKTPEVDTLVPNSPFFDSGLCKLFQPKVLIIKEKFTQVGELIIPHYYTIDRKSRRMYQAMDAIETGNKMKNFIQRAVTGVGQLFSFKPKAPKLDVLKPLQDAQQGLKQAQNTIETLKQENEKLKAEKAKRDSLELAKAKQDSTLKAVAKQDSIKKATPKTDSTKANSKSPQKADNQVIKKNNPNTNSNSNATTKNINPNKISQKTDNQVVKKKVDTPPPFTARLDTAGLSNDKKEIALISYDIDKVIYEINLRKDISQLQKQKLELEEKKKDLQSGSQATAKSEAVLDVKQREEDILRILENIERLLMQTQITKNSEISVKRAQLLDRQTYLRNELAELRKNNSNF
ncbi:MAG: hypothetical protein MUE85_03355 [Microscillaceae bacterium]|jgi:hypothetical protein|nr:hypothetical protein [Microscillaceae bacterium]